MSDLDLIRGTLDILVLKSISGEPLHGYAVAQWIKRASDEALLVEEGALYPALHRLARKGWVESEWGVSENNRRAKYYRLTSSGRKALCSESGSWDRYVDAVTKVMAADTGSS
jgi:PadR family transcriptional regulator